MKHWVRSFALGVIIPVSAWAASPGAHHGPGYTIAQIFARPGLTGYHPEQVQWSPK